MGYNSQYAELSKLVHKNGHRAQEYCDAPSPGAVLAHVVKPLEQRLQSKKLIPSIQRESFYPFWFLVETEKNIFLWRNGYSAMDENDFEFWVEIEDLIEKRIAQLQMTDLSNPFTNPFFDSPIETPTADECAHNKLGMKEADYLHSFLEVFKNLEAHVNALSQVGTALTHELLGIKKQVVVLPKATKRGPNSVAKNP